MANPIDLIITKQALDAIDSAITKVNALDKTLQATAQSFIESSKKMASATIGITPTSVNNKGADNAKLSDELEALKVKYASLSNELVVLNDKLVKLNETRGRGKKLTADEIVQNQQLRKEAISQAKANSDLIGSYEKLSLKHQQAVRNAQNLGATYGSTSKQFITASEKANKLDLELKGLDATLGKHQRNVGNYSSAYNGLGHSINQLTREAPAFANSLNTGFMALSNNIPMLFDEINKLKTANVDLAKSGEPTKNIFKTLAGAVFSWQTLLSVGVTLLTLYGGKLIEWGKNAFTASEGIVSMAKAQEDLVNAQERAIQNSRAELTHLDILISKYKDSNTSQKEKQVIIDELQSTYPKYFGNIDTETAKIIESGEAYKQLAKDILQVATNKAIEEDIVKNAKNTRDRIKEIGGEILDNNREVLRFNKAFKEAVDSGFASPAQLATINARRESFIKSNKELTAERDRLIKSNEKYAETLAKGIEITESPTTSIDKGKKDKKEKRPEIEQLKSFLKEGKPLIIEINEMMSRLSTERILATDEGRVEIDGMISKLSELKTALMGGLPTAEGTILNPVTPQAIEKVNELTEAMKNYLKSFSSEFMSESGFSKTFALLNQEIEGFEENFAVTFNAIAESAQEAFNFISNASQQNFDEEKTRLQSQYEVALLYAGDNKAAQEKLALDLEKSKKDIANRENRAKQKQAIFNIAIDTAQGIISALASTPPNIPLSIAIGVLGAAQIALVSSQEIPQYWMGGTHDGGLMMVNDGTGSNYRETIVTPDGKVMQPYGKNVLMNAPPGTEIFTHDQWNDQLNGMLRGNGINWSNQQPQSGISKNDMKEAMLEAIGEQPQYYTNFDGNGVVYYMAKRGNITRLNTNRSNGKGLKF